MAFKIISETLRLVDYIFKVMCLVCNGFSSFFE